MAQCKCLSCYNCKTRVFRSLTTLRKWCKKRECFLRRSWKDKLHQNGEIQLFWCVRNLGKVRSVLRSGTDLFIPKCKERVELIKFPRKPIERKVWVTCYLPSQRKRPNTTEREIKRIALEIAERFSAKGYPVWVHHYRDSNNIIFDNRESLSTQKDQG